MPYLHLPVQSGSDRMLAAMNRRHSRADYLRIIDRVRAARPDMALAGDFIVGFPGETEADFDDTLGSSRRSATPRPSPSNTARGPARPAAAMDQVPEAVKAERLARLQALIAAAQARFNASRVGMSVEVLFERPGRHPGQIVGRSPWLQPVQVDGDAGLIGSIVARHHHRIGANSLFGALVQAMPRRCGPQWRRSLLERPSASEWAPSPRSPRTRPTSSSPSTTTGCAARSSASSTRTSR